MNTDHTHRSTIKTFLRDTWDSISARDFRFLAALMAGMAVGILVMAISMVVTSTDDMTAGGLAFSGFVLLIEAAMMFGIARLMEAV